MYSKNFSPKEIKPLFDSIKKEIARLVEITEGYLQLTKKPKFNKKIVDITSLIYETIKFIEPEFNQKKIESEIILDKNRQVFIEIDENKIKQALINIIKNAMEAIDSDGKITIKLVEKEDTVIIDITDNGIGISEKDISDIFELFLTTKKYGTGLGLFSVKETIEEHGGKIVCNSTFGKGTTFSIYLPLNENLNNNSRTS
jgi:two-component system sporulation sensor kinase C